MDIKQIYTLTELNDCFKLFKELRPHLKDNQDFVNRVSQQMNEGYKLFVITEEKQKVAGIGFRLLNMLAQGKVLYIDDLITISNGRNHGYGRSLLEYAISFAKEVDCNAVHLDTGFTRYDAHKLYLKMGFKLHCHHLALML
jgi:GNAT superfamily N-acetyltransferase